LWFKSPNQLDWPNVVGLKTFGALGDLEFNSLTFLQTAEAVAWMPEK
jgi:hypothetical protein